jgi:SAM-dependent methyltransferase
LQCFKKKFSPAVEVATLDLTHHNFDVEYSDYVSCFDSVFALNVVEHIEDHNLAIHNAAKLLKPNGRLIILVPAFQWLYNTFDKDLEHFRRYSRSSLNELLIANGFAVVQSQYFNLMGIPGWFISGTIQRNRMIPNGQMKLYNLLVPFFRLIDKITFNAAGLSVISIGQKLDVKAAEPLTIVTK